MMEMLEPTGAQIAPMIDYVAAYRHELVATMANVGASTMGKAPDDATAAAPPTCGR